MNQQKMKSEKLKSDSQVDIMTPYAAVARQNNLEIQAHSAGVTQNNSALDQNLKQIEEANKKIAQIQKAITHAHELLKSTADALPSTATPETIQSATHRYKQLSQFSRALEHASPEKKTEVEEYLRLNHIDLKSPNHSAIDHQSMEHLLDMLEQSDNSTPKPR